MEANTNTQQETQETEKTQYSAFETKESKSNIIFQHYFLSLSV